MAKAPRHSSDRWELTRSALDALLVRLDRDGDRAAAAYEELRRRLVALLGWWGADQPHELADQALDRVAVKLHEGAVVPDASLHAYVRGVAHLVFQEWSRKAAREEQVQRESSGLWEGRGDVEDAHRALDGCLGHLTSADRRLILDYYTAEEASNIAGRRRLAMKLGLSATALRIRAHRVRERLQQCVDAALGRDR